MTAAAWDAWTRGGAHPCYQVRLTGPSHDIPYRRTDAGIALVSRACPVPLTDRGRVVALCLDGDACVVDAATGDVAPWRDGP